MTIYKILGIVYWLLLVTAVVLAILGTPVYMPASALLIALGCAIVLIAMRK